MFKLFSTNRQLRLFLSLIILVLVLFFLYLKVVPSGHISYGRKWPSGLRSGKGFISDFKPAERIDSSDSQSLKIVADPIYFSLFTPRAFDEATLTVKYRTKLSTDQPIIEAGVLKDKLTENYELRPLQNNIIDRLLFSWSRLEDTDSRLVLQAEKTYSSPEKFFTDLQAGYLLNCPSGPVSCVAVYNYPLAPSYQPSDYTPLKSLVIDQPLRGTHQFYLYLSREPWRLSFNFIDLNQDKAQDPITVSVTSGDKLITEKTLTDNNLTPESGKTEEKGLTLTGQDQPAGVYKVYVKISSDVVIAKIDSSSDKLSFINKVWPVSSAGGLTLLSDATYLQVHTLNPASLGVIKFGEQEFSLDKTDKQFVFSAAKGIKEIKLKKDDIVLESNGVFAFSRTSLFNPDFKKVDLYFSEQSGGIKYIIAGYRLPLFNDGLKTATAHFSLAGASREKGKYTFLISVPGLNGQTNSADYVALEEINLDLQGKTWWQKIKSIFTGAVKLWLKSRLAKERFFILFRPC